MVVGDQGALTRLAGLPVPPDPGDQGQQPLGDSDPDTGEGAAAVPFQSELVFARVEQALDPLPDPAQRPVPVGLISPVGAQQPGPMRCDQLLELLPGEALVAQDEQARAQPLALVAEHGRHDPAFAQLGAGQAAGDRQPVRSGQDIQPQAPEPAVMALQEP
jgi:hypothetical protein